MKFMIASDIHGSAKYCSMMVEKFKEEKADKLILLGDILYHGPRNDLPEEYNPKKVIKMLNELKNVILCVRGNCDAEIDQMVLEFPIMADYIAVVVENKTIFATHGHIFNPQNPLALKKNDILLCGHTHIPKNLVCKNFQYMNPGSISLPKENSFHSYMIFSNDSFTWKNLLTGKTFLPE